MLKEIVQSQQTKPELKKKLKEYVEAVMKNPSQIEKQLKLDTLVVTAHKLASVSYGLTLDLIFNSLSLEECFDYADNKSEKSIKLEFLDQVLSQKIPEKYLKLRSALNRHCIIEKAVAILAGYARFCVKGTKQEYLPTLLPRFIQVCAFVIEKYLKLKNQPANGSEDHIQTDQILLKNCEKWVASSITIFFENISIPEEPKIKQYLLYGIGDLIGALLEIMRQNTLKYNILDGLLRYSILKFTAKTYTYQQIYTVFDQNLKKSGYNNPEQKIQIPDTYETANNTQLNTQAFAYLTVHYLQHSNQLFSRKQKLVYLTVSTSEIISRPYEIKSKLIKSLLQILQSQKGIQIQSGKQLGYPLGLLWFNIWNNDRDQYDRLKVQFKLKDQSLLINILIQLKLLSNEKTNALINEYLLLTIQKQEISEERAIIILREITDQGLLNQQLTQIFIVACQKLSQRGCKQGVRSFLGELDRTKKIDPKVCQEIVESL